MRTLPPTNPKKSRQTPRLLLAERRFVTLGLDYAKAFRNPH